MKYSTYNYRPPKFSLFVYKYSFTYWSIVIMYLPCSRHCTRCCKYKGEPFKVCGGIWKLLFCLVITLYLWVMVSHGLSSDFLREGMLPYLFHYELAFTLPKFATECYYKSHTILHLLNHESSRLFQSHSCFSSCQTVSPLERVAA